MKTDCFIVEDLLPLYQEGLLHTETARWLEEHLQSCSHCNELAKLSGEPMETGTVAAPDADSSIAKIKLKVSIYQILFVALSLVIAMKTSLINNSFGFILTYTVLGLVTYLFYRRFLFILAIAFLPMFIWALADFRSFESTAFTGASLTAALHLIFAVVGGVIGWLIIKMKNEG